MGSTARYHQFFKFVNITTGKTYLIDELAGSLSDAAQNIDDLKEKLSKVTSAYVYHGSVANKDNLPTSAENGWVYNVESDGMNYAWNAEDNEWDALGPTIDLTPYATLVNLSDHASTTATSSITGHVILADNLDSSTIYAVPNAKTVKDYVDPKYSEFTTYKTATDATLGTLEQSIETNYNSLTSLSASVYNKKEIDEKFATNKGYIILRDYETIS